MEKDAEPHAFALSVEAERVDAVVPVSRAKQRYSVRAAARETVVDSAPAVFVQRGGAARRPRHEQESLLAGRYRFAFEERSGFIQASGIFGPLHIARDYIRQR